MYNPKEAKNGRPVAAFVCSCCISYEEKRFCWECPPVADSPDRCSCFFINLCGKALKNARILAFSQVDNVKNPDYTYYNPP